MRELISMGIIGIYSITNRVNGKKYIGQSWDIPRRWRAHKSTGHNRYLDRAYKKYGFDNFEFEILEEYTSENATQNILDEREIFYINKYNSTNYEYGYNLREGGNSGKMSDGTKKIISAKSKEMWSNPEIRNKIINSFKARPAFSQERIQKIRESSKGRHPTKKCIDNAIKARLGIKRGPITNTQSKKISESLKRFNSKKNGILRGPRNKAKYLGVYQYGTRWKAWCREGGKLKYIGSYGSEYEAYMARCQYIGDSNADES